MARWMHVSATDKPRALRLAQAIPLERSHSCSRGTNRGTKEGECSVIGSLKGSVNVPRWWATTDMDP